MTYGLDEFYDLGEPTTGDLVYEEIKNVILKTVKQQWIDEMERLRAENDELRPYKKDKERYERDLRMAKQQYENKLAQVERDVTRKTVRELLGCENILTAWRPAATYKNGPKCDKCDEHRRIHFKSPSGRDLTEVCSCAESEVIYQPEELTLVFFKLNDTASASQATAEWGDTTPPLIRYYVPKDYDNNVFRYDEEVQEGCKRVADDPSISFEELSNSFHRPIFSEKDRCQAYCDYLTKKEVAVRAAVKERYQRG